jgi:hypothetical protein
VKLELRYSLLEGLGQTFANKFVLIQNTISNSLSGTETDKISPFDDLSFDSGKAELAVTKSTSNNVLQPSD